MVRVCIKPRYRLLRNLGQKEVFLTFPIPHESTSEVVKNPDWIKMLAGEMSAGNGGGGGTRTGKRYIESEKVWYQVSLSLEQVQQRLAVVVAAAVVVVAAAAVLVVIAAVAAATWACRHRPGLATRCPHVCVAVYPWGSR